jgi:hypothetical protein
MHSVDYSAEIGRTESESANVQGLEEFNNFNSEWLSGQCRYARLPRSIFQTAVGVQNVLSSCRLMTPGLCVVFVPTSSDAEPVKEALRETGFRIIRIPKNPWLS